ncbi:MAG: hypothetical protein M3Y27_14815, partial [Acidobacteriota bacterium]|nr:hypothetical protein [Acidobacteriota bacterium]
VVTSPKFDVATAFPGYPARSVELAQRFVDLVQELEDGVQVQKQNRAIAFFPKAVFVEYLIARRSAKPGLLISFYGERREHANGASLTPGRPAFSRFRIESDQDLAASRPLIQRAFELRQGKTSHRL